MSEPVIIVGVTPWQPDSVVVEAIELAARLHGRILCVSVNLARYPVETRPDGTVVAESVDPDIGDVVVEEFDSALADRIRNLNNEARVRCDFLASAGNPGRVLADVANEHDALMIVVGTRNATFGGSVREFFSGSVAASLAHRQHRPVVVIPVNPVSAVDDALPWDGVSK